MSSPRIILPIFFTALIAGCSGSGGKPPPSGMPTTSPTDPTNPTNPTNPPSSTGASPGGVWIGTESISGLQVIGIASEGGDFHFIRADEVQYSGTASTDGDSLRASYLGFTPAGYVFADGSRSGSGTLNGTIVERESINATTEFTTAAGSEDSGTISLSYEPIYERDSDLSTIAGNYADDLTGAVVNINSNGEIFSQNPDNGCIANGQVSIIDERYNAYGVEWTYQNCSGLASAYNSLTFRGLATLDNAGGSEYALVGATAASDSLRYSVVLSLFRT